ncbi:hypothetical protein GDO86_013126 [Hymenochirus boettgeri]|uniref:Multimerin-2 n=1 Tax=Hymenochirus boettgeri TaxID=247094 RepID=A0A8T2IQ23_9PIPI|nr:hypothetical protein GDO86_013126 [Hymenochirus boettgeri]
MAKKLCVVLFCFGLILATSAENRHHYDAGLSPIGARIEVHGVSTYPYGLPGHTDDMAKKDDFDRELTDVPKTFSSESSIANFQDVKQSSPTSRKWCSYVRTRIVSFVNLCKTEKYVIRSQQNCPPGTPDCQKVMYRLAQKPVYEIKRKEVTNLEWKCCPGYIGSNCEETDPNSIQIPEIKAIMSEDHQESLLSPEVSDIMQSIQTQETLLKNIQNDIQQTSSTLMDLQYEVEKNASVTTHKNQTLSETEDRILREVFLPHVENYVREQFNPMWNSFNKSLQNLSNMVKDLSENVETNRERMDTFLENTVLKKDLYELGTKFESKVQENIVKVDQIRHELDNHLHAQQAGIHYNLTIIKADTDMKFKKIQKLQQSQCTSLNISIDEIKREQEYVLDQLQSVAQNVTDLWMSCSTGGREATHVTNHQINKTLAEFKDEIRDLYTESDAVFENIATLEKWFKELRTEFKKNAEAVQISFMEKSLILEENKDFLLRQIMEINSTISSIQQGSDDLLKNCDCQKITLDILALEESQKNFSNLLKNVSYGIEDVKQKEGFSKTSLQNSVEDLSMALHLIRQSLTSQQEKERVLSYITSHLQSQAKNFSDDVTLLKKDNDLINNHIKLLDSTFSTLLEDAIRHNRALEALLGDDVLEVMSEDNPVVLQMSIMQIYQVINETIQRLEKQKTTTDSLKRRVEVLEMHPQKQDSPDFSAIFNVEQQTEGLVHEGRFKKGLSDHMQPIYEGSKDEPLEEMTPSDITTLKNDIRQLSLKLVALETHVTEENHYNKETILKVIKPLNISLVSVKSDILNLRELFAGHVQIFHKIFRNYETMIASNASLNIENLRALVDKKMKKKESKGALQHAFRDKEMDQLWQSDGTGRKVLKQDSPLVFSAGFTGGAEGVKILLFDKIFLNYGDVFSLEDGHFTAPYNGVYAFAITVDFGPGNAMSHLVFGGRQKVILYNNNKQESGSLKYSFAVVELQKDDKVWLELLQGSIKKNSYGTRLEGYLIFKT